MNLLFSILLVVLAGASIGWVMSLIFWIFPIEDGEPDE